jgi:hypothetical protein
MLEVGPGRCTFPMPASVVVAIAKTLLLFTSKVAAMFRVGEIAIRPGELPALSGDTRGRVSFAPSIITRLPKEKVEVTPCEARTRFFRPLGGPVLAYPPQEMQLRLAHKTMARTKMRFFKRQAPKDMKKGDLIAKWWIITDPAPRLVRVFDVALSDKLLFSNLPPSRVVEMHERGLILYSQKLYGG